MTAYVNAFGFYLPERVVPNEELAARVGCTAEWIESVSGIRERRWADPETSVTDLAELAARDCLARAGTEASHVGLLLLASGSAKPGFPAPAAELAHRLGLNLAPALDLPMASAGSIFGLVLASQLAEVYGNVLVVAAEKMSGVVEAHALDQNTAILFGDGAGAALVSPRPEGRKILGSALHTDGQFRGDLSYDWTSPLKMNGLTVILQAARKLPTVISEVLQAQGIAASTVGTFLLHQANHNLLTRVAKALQVPAERVYSNVERYGNTSSASLLIAAAEWSREGASTEPVVLAGFGAGLHWGAMVAQGVLN
jgi:3-oxoacyl-[acyl-carrier-protein] synthase-3